MNESFGENLESDKKPELGSFEVGNEDGIYSEKEKVKIIARKDISYPEILKNQKDYKESKERKKAINDIEDIWGSLFVEIPDNIKDAMKDVQAFEIFVNNLLKRKDVNPSEIRYFFRRFILDLEFVGNLLKENREIYLDFRLDMEDKNKNDFDPIDKKELKEKSENEIQWVDVYLERVDTLIQFIKAKLSGFL